VKGDHLGEFEELVLLAVRRLGADATGSTIRELLRREARRGATLGAIYAALDRSQRKQWIASRLGPPLPVPGGRRRRHYAITATGEAALSAAHGVRNALWRTARGTAR
jgi:DNA-binding PadR family transcriptional regulator